MALNTRHGDYLRAYLNSEKNVEVRAASIERALAGLESEAATRARAALERARRADKERELSAGTDAAVDWGVSAEVHLAEAGRLAGTVLASAVASRNASKPRTRPELTSEAINEFLAKWRGAHGGKPEETLRGDITAASVEFACDEGLITRRLGRDPKKNSA